MGQIASDFYQRFGRIDAMEIPFEAQELLQMASVEVQEEYAGWLAEGSSGEEQESYIPGDVLLALLQDRAFFAELLMMRDAGEYVVLSGVTIGVTSAHIEKMGLTPEDAAENIARFLENEESFYDSIRSAMAGRHGRVSGLCVFSNGWFSVETETPSDQSWMERAAEEGEEIHDSFAAQDADAYEPAESYLFSDEGDLVATPDLRYDIDAWMDFVDLFSAIHEEAAATDKQHAFTEEEDSEKNSDENSLDDLEDLGKGYIVFSKEVREAMQEGRPVVVIESAATFGGMIYPGISDFAFWMQKTVRDNGAAPAFAAILHGKIHMGLEDDEIRYLEKKRGSIYKASARDIPILLAMHADGCMTIAAAVQIAALVGLRIACGSGIGGAQIGAEKTMDISTDLQSVAQNKVMVVCSGTKPILDLNLTMEYLETAGVPVIGYRTDRMPEYMVRGSGFRLTYRMDTPEELAEVMRIKTKMNIPGGILVVNPIPRAFELDHEKINRAVDAAMRDVEDKHIMGKAITGYMMGRIREYLGDKSVESQKAFLINNAALAAKIARSLCG